MASTEVNTTTPLFEQNLDKLPVQVNAVLVQIGKLLRFQTRPELKVIDKQKFQAHEGLAKINRQFHESLDEVEHEILNAKAVLERDLNRIRTRRAERERIQQAIASKAMIDESAARDQDIQMHDFADAVSTKNQSPEGGLIDINSNANISDSTALNNNDHDMTSGNETMQDVKDVTLDDDLFGGGHDDFGPDGEVTSFDFTAGGDFDMDFAMPADGTNTAVTNAQSAADPAATAGAAASETLADNDLLLQDFADINSSGDVHANGFGDLDFGNVDTTQDEADSGQNPFGNDDDGFGNFFDL